MRYALIHNRGCGKVAFYLIEKLNHHDYLAASNVINVDGSHFEPGSFIICGSCKQHMSSHDLNTTDIIEEE